MTLCLLLLLPLLLLLLLLPLLLLLLLLLLLQRLLWLLIRHLLPGDGKLVPEKWVLHCFATSAR
jgi:hypothetical protein